MFDFLLEIDYRLFSFVNSGFTATWADAFFVWITDLHKTAYFNWVAVPLVLGLFLKKFKRSGLTFFFFMILCLSTSDFVGGKVKSAFERPRPILNEKVQVVERSSAGHFAFYSNHASNMFAFAQYVSFFVPPLRPVVFSIAALVAYSRVYNGVHYPSDVLFGALMGFLWGWIFSRSAKKLVEFIQLKKAGTGA